MAGKSLVWTVLSSSRTKTTSSFSPFFDADDDIVIDVGDVFEIELDLIGVDVFAIARDDRVFAPAFDVILPVASTSAISPVG
jgi:hypothetical protein